MSDGAKTEETKKTAAKKILSVAAYAVVGLLMLCIAFVLFSNLSGNILFIGGKSAMWVKTESMEPVIPQKSYILVQKATAADVKEGDVIIFRSDDPSLKNALNTHRVVEIVDGGREFVTKGDNNIAADSYTAKADKIVGIYRKRLPVLSFLGRFLSTAGGITVMAILMLAIILISFLPDITEGMRKKEEVKKQAEIDRLVQAEIEKLKAENNDADTPDDQ